MRRGKESSGPAPLVELTVDRLAWGGRGVGRHGGKVVFVSKSVPGDRLKVVLTKTRSSFCEGRIAGVMEPSPDRVDPECPWFGRCGGCQWLAVSYDRQLQEKDAMLRHALRHHLESAKIEPLVPADPRLGYRHRGDFHARVGPGGLRLGFYEEGSHRLVEASGCLLFPPAFAASVERVRHALADTPAGAVLDRLTLACSEGEEGAQVAHARLRPGASAQDAAGLVRNLMAAGLGAALATDGTRAIASEGAPWIRFGVPGPKGDLRLSAEIRSFTQAHFAMNRRLVAAAMEWLGACGSERLLDLYSGIGNFTLPLAFRCGEVVAVEGSPTACADARANAAAHGARNILHLEGDTAAETARLAGAGERFDSVLLDPPRTGAREVLPALARLGASRILYISCNLPCLERDLGLLRGLGYSPTRARGFDGFPQTYGVETLCLLERG